MNTPETRLLRTLPIQRISVATPTVKTFAFDDNLCAKAKPGQFAMIWVPGKDDIPMSLTTDFKSDMPMIVVKNVGEATAALHSLRPGDLIGVKGPFGSHFKLKAEKRILCVAGGTGVTPFINIIKTYARSRTVHLILGATTRRELLFYDQLQRLVKVMPVTEDGSLGRRGQATDLLTDVLGRGRYNLILGCGPEAMAKTVVQAAEDHHIPAQVSLERVMKCGVGICGSCGLAGFRVCTEGPVFNTRQVRAFKNEFYVFTRDHSGRRVSIGQQAQSEA